ELLVMAPMSLAIQGNATALREVWERLDGKMPQPVDDVAAERQRHAELARMQHDRNRSGKAHAHVRSSERKNAARAGPPFGTRHCRKIIRTEKSPCLRLLSIHKSRLMN